MDIDATRCGRTTRRDPSHHVSVTPKPSLDQKRIKLWFTLLLLLALAVRLVDPIGWLGSDDAAYHAAAEHVVHGEPIHRNHHQYARSPIVLAVSVSMLLFGDTPAALILPTLISSILCIVMVVLIGRLLWDWWVGLLAGTIVAFLPAFQNTSTCLLPGAYTCCFAAAAILVTVMATGATQRRAYWSLAVAAGLLAAMAISAKLFTGAVFVAIFFLSWQLHAAPRGRRVVWMALVLAGAVLFLLLECTFYAWTADNFWFKFQALEGSRGAHTILPGHKEAYSSLSETLQLVLVRLTMPFRLAESGWGTIGYAFWPAVLAAAFLDRRARGLAVWAGVTFLGVAFVPISLANGIYVFPAVAFNGINLIVLSVPFALCLAWAVHRLTTTSFPSATIHRYWPVALIAVALVSNVDRYRVNGRSMFIQQQIGSAIRQMVATADFGSELPIFTTPSIYWRYRVLFPKRLRDRLRVTAQADAPDWWRDVSVDIEQRLRPLPHPNQAYLLATPEQVQGKQLSWDYGVGLPKSNLAEWQVETPLAVAVRSRGTVTTHTGREATAPGVILCLFGPTPAETKMASSREKRF